MLTTSKPEGFNASALGEPEVHVLSCFWNHAQANAQPNMVLPREQPTYIDALAVDVSAGRPWMFDCANTLTRTAFTDIANVALRRPIHATQDGGLVIDPSAMEVNQPYALHLPSVTIWAVKDDTGDVIFYRPEE